MNPSDQELDLRLESLTREAPPPKRVWLAVAKEIEPTRNRNWPWIAVAAAVAFTTLALVLQPWQDDRQLSPTIAPPQAWLVPSPDTSNWQPVLIEHAGLSHPWEANQRAIEALEQALQDDPGNPMLQEFLANARLRQAELIQLSTRSAPGTSI